MDDDTRAKLLSLQRMEANEAEVYRRLAKMQPDPVNQSILNGIALEEERHEAVIAKMTGKQVKADASKVRRQIILAKLFGFTFSVKMMEATEQDAAAEYRELGLYEIAEEEEAHEQNMIGMLDEERLRYSGSVVLGMSDALVELTGRSLASPSLCRACSWSRSQGWSPASLPRSAWERQSTSPHARRRKRSLRSRPRSSLGCHILLPYFFWSGLTWSSKPTVRTSGA